VLKKISRAEVTFIVVMLLLIVLAIVLVGKESYKVLAGLVIGAAFAPIIELVTRFAWGPRLSVELDPYFPPRDVPNREVYVRLKIENTKKRLAKSCGAYLANVEKFDSATGCFAQTDFHDTFSLHWAYNAALANVDLPLHVPRFLDLVSVPESGNGIRPHHIGLPEGQDVPLYRPIWNTNGHFRLTVLVTAEGIEPEVRRITVDWRGEWPPKLAIEKP
jgi:hypothetical protein